MSTNSSQETEIDPAVLIGVFVFVFWPVSLALALLEFLFFRGSVPFLVNLVLASLAGWAGVKKYQADARRKNQAT